MVAIVPEPATSRDEDKTIEWARKRWDSARSAQEPYVRDWMDYERAYWAQERLPSPGDGTGIGYKNAADAKKGLNRFFTPWCYSQLQSAKPNFIEADPAMRCEPRESADEDRARMMQQLLGFQFEEDKLFSKKQKVVDDALIYGPVIGKITWRNDKQKVKRYKDAFYAGMLPEGEDPFETVEEVMFNGPSVHIVSCYDWFPDPNATSMDDMEFAIHRVWLTAADLKAREDKGIYRNTQTAIDAAEDPYASRTRATKTRDADGKMRNKGLIEVIEIWTKTRVVVLTVDNFHLLRDDENPFTHGRIPFVLGGTEPDPRHEKLYDVSAVWAMAELQRALWEQSNAAQAIIDLTLNPPIAYDAASKAFARYKGLPGERVPTTGGDPSKDYHMIQYNFGAAIGLINPEGLRQQLEMASGIDRQLAGQTQSGAQTATQILQMNKEVKQRLALKVARLNEFWQEIAKMFILLNQQFLEKEQVIKVVGPDGALAWETINPADLRCNYDIKVKSATEMLNTELMRQQYLDALNNLMPFNGMQLPTGETITVAPMFDKVVRSYDMDPADFKTAPVPITDPATGLPVAAPGMAPDPVAAAAVQALPGAMQAAVEQPPQPGTLSSTGIGPQPYAGS